MTRQVAPGSLDFDEKSMHGPSSFPPTQESRTLVIFLDSGWRQPKADLAGMTVNDM
jgi:hypothetical protein